VEAPYRFVSQGIASGNEERLICKIKPRGSEHLVFNGKTIGVAKPSV
jgi:hypothetical protein